jgi:hypothetical protein
MGRIQSKDHEASTLMIHDTSPLTETITLECKKYEFSYDISRYVLENCNSISHRGCRATSYVSIRPDP